MATRARVYPVFEARMARKENSLGAIEPVAPRGFKLREVESKTMTLNETAIGKKTLDDLRRERGFPFVRLTARASVYLADEVLAWLKEQARR